MTLSVGCFAVLYCIVTSELFFFLFKISVSRERTVKGVNRLDR